MRKLKTIEMNRLSVDDYRQAPKIPLVIVLEDVRSQYNVGSIFRTADACAVEKLILCGITACPPTVEIHKTALGAENSVAWEYVSTAKETINRLHQMGYRVFAAEQCKESILLPKRIKRGERYAVVVGNEVKGVSQQTIDKCDGCIEIPQFGTKHSLNVSVATSIIAWEFLRQIKLNNKN